jgi:hypothetical protein
LDASEMSVGFAKLQVREEGIQVRKILQEMM